MTTATPTLAGKIKTPRAGTKRATIIGLIARENGVSPGELYKMYPMWGKRHINECKRILVRDYGYPIVVKNGNLCMGKAADTTEIKADNPAAPVAGATEGGDAAGGAPAEGDEVVGGGTEEVKPAEGGEPAAPQVEVKPLSKRAQKRLAAEQARKS